ncbi:3-isopropylmalate dehydrogenase [Pseudoblastomonas halimionae]|uniref:3-isopropylmalate dehydrogenase n=1 Tax=Alteriqipengyuania halimionae TaxID=1926630 RepID=A0A6I4U552_9SPHN|nr:3-isopropylmalate dehydrogenase [Alteriqipengyuania halimionae]MXP09367.1 3-isopropylmalate dehydrogenase [Alteriqipengyuania halimionae]
MTTKIVFLPGDGVGPEVIGAAEAVLAKVSEQEGFSYAAEHHAFGGAAIDSHGDPFPTETRAACLAADAVILGAVGGPKWAGGSVRPEQGLLAMRSELGTFANLRPATIMPGLEALSPLRPERVTGCDLLIVRELTGGLYFGDREEGSEAALDTCRYSRDEVERIARIAFDAARGRRGKLTSVDKANVLATSRLWRSVVDDMATDYPDVTLDHMLVDAAAMRLVSAPTDFDVILTENLFGDILSDQASAVAGSIGLAPSASLGSGKGGIFEPIHGSAPDIAGQGKANPVGTILSLAMALRHSLDQEAAAVRIETAVSKALADGHGTFDLGCSDSTKEMTAAICERL